MGFFDLIIVQPIFNLLLLIYSVVGDFGVAIILFTLIVKFAMWPLVKKQLHQTKLMRKLQPELAEIKKRCKGNRQMESLQMMDLYKKHNVKPFRSLLVMIVQLPVFIALYSVVRMVMTDSESVARFAYGFVKGIPNVQAIISDFGAFEPKLFGLVDLRVAGLPLSSVSAFVILAMVLAAVLVQRATSKQQLPKKKNQKKFKDIMKEAAEGKEADQNELNSIVSSQMSSMMPIMMLFVFIGLPGALVLYYLTTNIISLVQQKIIFSKSEDEMEELADKKVLKELRDVTKIREAEVVKTKSKENITRISIKDKKRRKKK